MKTFYMIKENSTDAEQNVTILNNANGVLTFSACLQDISENRNKRRYLKETFIQAFKNPSFLERIGANSFVGEAAHPLNKETLQTINHRNISHIIKRLTFDGKKVVGTHIETSATSAGQDFYNLLTINKIVPAFSLRAWGTNIDQEAGISVVKPPIEVISYDWVFIPSHRNAYSGLTYDDILARGSSCVELSESDLMHVSSDFKTLTESFDISSIVFNADTEAVSIIINPETSKTQFTEVRITDLHHNAVNSLLEMF